MEGWIRHLQKRNAEMIHLKDSKMFRNLKEDARYWELYEKVGFKAWDKYLQRPEVIQ